jgi:hypothetical protein
MKRLVLSDSPAGSPSPPPVVFSAAKAARVYYDCNDQNDEIQAGDRLRCVHEPGVDQDG